MRRSGQCSYSVQWKLFRTWYPGSEERKTVEIPMVDLFAGPGGLNEGFSRASSAVTFRSAISIEKEHWAHETLILRAAVRSAGFPDEYYAFLNGEITEEQFRAVPEIASALNEELARSPRLELGEANRPENDALIGAALSRAGIEQGSDRPWALIGGPPCQAYSLAGRSRRTHDETFAEDKKHFLYREYLHILDTFRPPVFVMENVRGMLSSKNKDSLIFRQIKRDLELDDAYTVFSLVSDKSPEDLEPADFLIHADQFGIPQARQRVILLGVRKDVLGRVRTVPTLVKGAHTTVRDAIGDLPTIRSSVSPRRADSDVQWSDIRQSSARIASRHHLGTRALPASVPPRGSVRVPRGPAHVADPVLREWLEDENLTCVLQHEARAHMPSDLWRYFYWARFVELSDGREQPNVKSVPVELVPEHKNIQREDTPFTDRFWVQAWSNPSSTIVAHLAKDGHHFIHPDPMQMRSLTVREAARLQTFPDNYYFMGPRTAQYQQIGNAVPPLLARQIGEAVGRLLVGAFPTTVVPMPEEPVESATSENATQSDAA